MIQTFYRNGKTHYNAFLPLVVDCCLAISSDYINVSELQEKYKEIYGVSLPIYVLKKILLIGVKQGFFTNTSDIFCKTEKLMNSNIKTIQAEYIAKHESLINGFIDFYHTAKGKELKYDEGENAMLAFMEENVYKVIKNYTQRANETFVTTGAEEKIAFGRYIKAAIENNNETTINYLADIAKGVMIHNVVYLPNTDDLERKFTNTYLIFDTPLVLSLLGYAGNERQRAIQELLDLAKSTGASLGVFDFTVSEVISVLRNCAETIRNKKFSYHGHSVDYFIGQNYTYEQIIVFINRVEKDIKNKHSIDILQKTVDEKTQMMDEIKMENCIDKMHEYQNRSTKLRDIDSLAGTYSLRKGSNPYYFENSRAIFVTSNFPLVLAAKEYFKDERQHIDLAMTDFYITNILWLKKPTKHPDLPIKRAIADIYAALSPSDDLWNQFVHTLEEMKDRSEITYDDVISLQTAEETPDLLMEASAGGVNILSPSSVQEIRAELERNKENKQKEIQKNKLMQKANSIASKLSWGLSLLLSLMFVIALTGQTFDVKEFKINANFVSLQWVCTVVFFVLTLANLFLGATVGGLIKVIANFLTKYIYLILGKLLEGLTK